MPSEKNIDCLVVKQEIYRSITGIYLSKLIAKSFVVKDFIEGKIKTIGLTHTDCALKFLFSNNSDFYAMSVNGGNCFVYTLILNAFLKK